MHARNRPTMKDVASAAGVSFKTVSRVVNAEAGVSAAVLDRVQTAIDTLGYRPDHRARTLRSAAQQVATVGFIHADMANPFSAAVHSGFEAVATSHECLILSGSSAEQTSRQEALIQAFLGRRVDGLAVIPVGDADAPPSAVLAAEIRRGLPVVFIDREPGLEADIVLSDHRGGAELATKHLLSRGHRRIAFLGSREHVHSVRERRGGFESCLSDAGIDDPTIITGISSADDATSRVHRLFDRPTAERPTALFTAQNALTLGAVRALHQLGLQHEIALVGFDDTDAADIVQPGITTVPQDAAELGRRAGELLFDRVSTGRTTPIREVVPVTLVQRGSGEVAPPAHLI